MARHLVIVESPAKAKTINRYLGKDYIVKASIGHIRDLPTGGEETDPADRLKAAREAKAAKGKAAKAKAKAEPSAEDKKWTALVRRMGVDPEHGWTARYEISPGKEKVVKELREYAEKVDSIFLASDLDREGEAIAWHLQEVLGGDAARFRRVTFNEITKASIAEAFKHPGSVNMDRVNAQQARRFLDRVVGFQVSPLLWSKVARGLSAGRVQSVATRLIVEREREISAFKPDEYWEVHCDLLAPAPVRAQAVREAGKPFKPVNKQQADAAVAKLKTAAYAVANREDKPTRAFPNAPFITSTLQAAASNRLSFSVKKTMTMAQRLYEAGHITYMRTDSVNLSADALTAVRTLIQTKFGAKYLPAEPVRYASKSGAQEAHEAIRPTDPNAGPGTLDVEADAQRLYDLIWRQFVACQMPPAEFDTTSVLIKAADIELVAKGKVLRFDGFYKVLPPAKGEDQVLPPLTAGQALKLARVDPTQHFTKPPARYSEAGLVKELEKRGIGRPSTYASIISTIQERGYVKVEARRFFAEKLGEIVTDRLVAAFPDLLDYGFTAGLERELDVVAEGNEDWKRTLDRFYKGFKGRLANADATMPAVEPTVTPIACATCGRPMAIRTARTGVFLSCTGYSLPPKERCTGTMNLVPGIESESAAPKPDDADLDEDQASDADAAALHDRRRCQICGTAMDPWLLDATRRLHICHNQPACTGVQVETGTFRIKGYEGPSLPCDKCGLQMQLRTGRFGKYFACTGYPVCANTRKLLRSGQAAPPKAQAVHFHELACPKGGHYVFRDGAAGVFLASSDYPKVRDARNPLVRELLPHRDELDPKFHYLCEAPAADPQGNPTVIRYSKKTASQYVASERDGKPTGWTRVWQGGAWVEPAAGA